MTQPAVVGIVTRTKNRRVLLKRALESVLFQSYPHWTMVIVNDGGDRDDVEALIAGYAAEAAGRIRVIHNARSLGMEGASKVGLDALDTDLLIVHDDDDSWAPEFLTVAVHELQRVQTTYPGVQGVTTYANLVMEQVHGNLVRTDSVEPFNDWAPAGFVSLDRILASNFIPPISFLFTRAAFDELGGLYEAIPYVGDWDFLVRFLSKYDVFMIPQFLAFYHWRSRAKAGVLGNSVTGEVDRHHFYRQYLLNQWLRADIAAGRFGIGAYANLRAHVATIVDQLNERPAPAAAPARAPAPAPAAAAAAGAEAAPPDVPDEAPDDSEHAPEDVSADGAVDVPGNVPNAAAVAEPNPAAAELAAATPRPRVARVLGRLRAWTTALSERKH